LKVQEINIKSIITKSKLPGADYVINPYVGCSHGCRYCYACFMKRFVNHDEAWGEFVDVKINALDTLKNLSNYQGKSITIGSVTDPYQPIEKKYQLTRALLGKLLEIDVKLCIMTKSPLIQRDIDLLKQFSHLTVLVTSGFYHDSTRNIFEPRSANIEDRLAAVRDLSENGIQTNLFISPILPELTDWKSLVNEAKPYVESVWFENLNFYPAIRNLIFYSLTQIDRSLIPKYQQIYKAGSSYWDEVASDIENYCLAQDVNYKLCFHHSAS